MEIEKLLLNAQKKALDLGFRSVDEAYQYIVDIEKKEDCAQSSENGREVIENQTTLNVE